MKSLFPATNNAQYAFLKVVKQHATLPSVTATYKEPPPVKKFATASSKELCNVLLDDSITYPSSSNDYPTTLPSITATYE